jgi:plasmid maintenance system antidote protein VapI
VGITKQAAILDVLNDEDKLARVTNRFWKYVNKTDGCWLWTGSRTTGGYGQFGVGGRKGTPIGTHRVAWALANGAIPDGLCVCHRCDNPPCVRPDHLFLGTLADNFDDMRAKGRNERGMAHHYAKHTDEQVIEVRRAYADGQVSQAELVRRFGIASTTIGNIVHRRTWTHLSQSDTPDIARKPQSPHLSREAVIEIRRAVAAGEGTQTELAHRFGVRPCSVSQIVNRKAWKHI